MIKDAQGRLYKDATELPGAIVVDPLLDPEMIYDPETKRVTDRHSGDYFISQNISSINRIYQGFIWSKAGELLERHQYRYGGSRLPNGGEKSVYEVLWTMRGEDEARLNEIGGQKVATKLAQNDSLERLASFLRAQKIGYCNGVEKGQVALVDRRTDDLSGEMR